MTRLIDAEELMEWADNWVGKIPADALWGKVRRMIVHDAVPVIRCSECKFVGTDATCCFVCNRDGMGLRPYHVHNDDYCSYGERKDNG